MKDHSNTFTGVSYLCFFVLFIRSLTLSATYVHSKNEGIALRNVVKLLLRNGGFCNGWITSRFLPI